MTDAEIVARAIRSAMLTKRNSADDMARAVVAALTEAGRIVPEITREFVSEPGESFDDARRRMEQSARSWTECVTDISMRGDGIWVFTMTAPAFLPAGCVSIDAGRWGGFSQYEWQLIEQGLRLAGSASATAMADKVSAIIQGTK